MTCSGGPGIWPAVWMLPVDNAYGPWPASGEIDVFELVRHLLQHYFSRSHCETKVKRKV